MSTVNPVTLECNQICIEDDLRMGRVMGWKVFRETTDFLERALRPHKVVIAGGAIRDMYMVGEAMIKDYDAWVLDVEEVHVPQIDKALQEAYRGMSTIYPADSNWTDYPQRTFHSPKANIIFPWVPGKKPTQIMYSGYKTIEELIANFDWHCCAFGLQSEKLLTDGITDFNEGRLSLNETTIHNPKSTLRRGFHLEQKYRTNSEGLRLRLPNELILALAAMLNLNPRNGTNQKS